jgi:hypothetical protein
MVHIPHGTIHHCCISDYNIPYVAVLWIRVGFNADPDPAFDLKADPDSDKDPESKTNGDPCESGLVMAKLR